MDVATAKQQLHDLHDVVKGIHDELDAATNPTLAPQKLHDLKTKLRTMVNEIAQAIANEAGKVETVAQTIANETKGE